MRPYQISTAVAIRDLKCNSDTTTRNIGLLQKKIFLAQELGLPLGYGFTWYVHGPYSKELTGVAIQVISEGNDAIEDNYFKEPYVSLIEAVNSLENRISELQLHTNVMQWYELLVFVAYWCRNGCDTEQQMIKKIQSIRPQLSRYLIHVAYISFLRLKLCY